MANNFISNKIRLEKSENIIQQDVQDEIIMLNLNNENYLGLDKVGARFWHILLNSKSTKEAYERILDEYDVDPDTLEQDLNNLIDELEINGLVKISSI